MEGTSKSTHADALLRDFPRIPADLLTDCNRLFDNYIFFEPIGRGEKQYICTACYQRWYTPSCLETYEANQIAHARHNDTVQCPHCSERVTLKSLGTARSRRSLDAVRHILFLWAASENLVCGAAAYVYKNYSDEFETLQLDYSVDALYTFEPGETHSWRRKWCYAPQNTWMGRFEETRTTATPFASNIASWIVSPVGLTEAVQNSFLRYCAFDKGVRQYNYRICASASDTDELPDDAYCGEHIVKWLADYCRYPKIEMLAKLGFTQIINDTVLDKRRYPKLLNWRASTPHGFFRMPKSEFAVLARYAQSVDVNTLRELRDMREADEPAGIEDHFRYKSRYTISTLIGVKKRAGVSLAKLVRYLDGARMNKQIVTDSYKAQTYRDYLDMAEAVGFDLTQDAVKFPKNLEEAHDRALSAFNAIKIERQKHEGAELYEKLSERFAYEDEEFLIRPPCCAAEIVAEGQALHHCVAGYADRHCNGKTVILLLRKKSAPDVPYFTIEMDPVGGVYMKQIHGLRNIAPDTPELAAFVNAYKQYLADRQRKAYKTKNEAVDIVAAV